MQIVQLYSVACYYQMNLCFQYLNLLENCCGMREAAVLTLIQDICESADTS